MGRKHLSDETRKSIVRLRQDGYTFLQISEILGVNKATCNTVCLRHRKRTTDTTPPVEPAQAVHTDGIDWHARCLEMTDRCLLLNDENIKLKDDIVMLKACIKRLL